MKPKTDLANDMEVISTAIFPQITSKEHDHGLMKRKSAMHPRVFMII